MAMLYMFAVTTTDEALRAQRIEIGSHSGRIGRGMRGSLANSKATQGCVGSDYVETASRMLFCGLRDQPSPAESTHRGPRRTSGRSWDRKRRAAGRHNLRPGAAAA